VIQGADTADLVAMLPWRRLDDPLSPGPDPGQDESQILAACDFWLVFPFANRDSDSLTMRLASTGQAGAIESAVDHIPLVDSDELNEIDAAATPEPQPDRSWWLGGLLVVLGGAVSARLAVIYLMNHRPDLALSTLQATRVQDRSNELRQRRRLIEARALSESRRYDVALELIANLEGPEGACRRLST
jgi:hypothetical protein